MQELDASSRLTAMPMPDGDALSRRRSVEDGGAVPGGAEWWRSSTAPGGEGMVVKPLGFRRCAAAAAWCSRRSKCRGSEYLRIIYGPEYDLPAQSGAAQKARPRPEAVAGHARVRAGAGGAGRASSPASRCAACTSACSRSSRWKASRSIRACRCRGRRRADVVARHRLIRRQPALLAFRATGFYGCRGFLHGIRRRLVELIDKLLHVLAAHRLVHLDLGLRGLGEDLFVCQESVERGT